MCQYAGIMVVVMGSPVGDRIKHLRELRRMTQWQVEIAINALWPAGAPVKRSWLSVVESGELKNPGGERLDKVARYFGVSSRYLLTGEQDVADAGRLSLLEQLKDLTDEQVASLIHIGHQVFFSKQVRPDDQTEAKPESERDPDSTPDPQN